jgi:hypothetical protein
MKLSDIFPIIESYVRPFCEVFKQYEYKDDNELRDYLDFVIHEPSEWLKGFPTQWKTKSQFTQVRAAFHKLLKSEDVINAYGETYCHHVHEIVWNTFKKDLENVLDKRNTQFVTTTSDSVIPESVTPSISSNKDIKNHIQFIYEDVSDIENTEHNVWQNKYDILEKAFLELINPSEENNDINRLRRSMQVLLTAFKHQ